MSDELNNILETKPTEAQTQGTSNEQQSFFENTLTGWANIFLVLSIISGLIGFYYAGRALAGKYDDWGEKGISFAWIAVSVAAILQGVLIQLLLKGLAEIIRLLRKK